MGVITISTFNSVVYFALNYTQVINAVLVLAAIPALTIILSSLMKIEKTNLFQIFGYFYQYRNWSNNFKR
jgi:drug/metabolite transporter (DMT)-like permease